ncbi:alpha/beta fold hydrolase [[Empedobacter] haloabium]|uniref:Alpha/beta fold hydrolase n=1 Tax=[Empedobacter] haloabium TaxID=592317 RepID=A0ABZ1UDE3_9BURK
MIAPPANAKPGRHPLVVLLHGTGASARQVMGLAFPPSPLSVFLEIAARDDVVVIAPDAGKGGWSDCFVSGERAAAKNDVAFIGALIDHAIAVHDVDPARVYVIGVSRGGWMTYRLTMEIPHKLAAFATVLSGMPEPGHGPLPATALPALIVGCTADRLLRYHGGKHWYAPRFVPRVRGIEATARFWRELAGLPDTPETAAVPQHDPNAVTRATRFTWGDKPEGMQVMLYRVDGAGHAEPSRLKRYPGLLDYLPGRQNGDFEVAEAAWAFFRCKGRERVVPNLAA